MKWIKVAIGAVIAVLSIGIIATTVFKMTQPRKVIREVSFEIDPVEGKYYPLSIFNKIFEYGVLDDVDGDGKFEVINIASIYVNNEIAEIYVNVKFGMDGDLIYFYNNIPISDDYIDSYIDVDGNWIDDGSTLTNNVNIKLVFTPITQPPQLSGINATLILLIPLVFVGGLLLYFYKPLKKD